MTRRNKIDTRVAGYPQCAHKKNKKKRTKKRTCSAQEEYGQEVPRHKPHGETAKKNSFFFCDYFNCIFCQTPLITTSHRHSKNYLCHDNLDIVANITSESCRPALLEDWLECGMCCRTGHSMFYIFRYFLSIDKICR